MRSGIEHARHGIQVAFEIGRQHFHLRRWAKHLPDGADRFGKVGRAAIVKIVAIHRGDHHILAVSSPPPFQPHAAVLRGRVKTLFCWRALGHGTKSTAARAQVAQNHEGGSAAVKALVNVRAARRFANGVQMALPQLPLKRVDRFEMGAPFAQPNRQRPLRPARFRESIWTRDSAGTNPIVASRV